MKKKCTKCKRTKKKHKFSKNSQTKSGLHSWCKKCVSENHRERAKKDPYYSTKGQIKARYGITVEEYKTRMATSNQCEICGSFEYLVYDHCHETMKFRGVLCRTCNYGIGHLGDTYAGVKKALDYLERSCYTIGIDNEEEEAMK